MNKKIKIVAILSVFLGVIYSCKNEKDEPKPTDTVIVDPVPVDTTTCTTTPSITIKSTEDVSCGNSVGYIVVSASGGTGGNYMFSKNGTDFQVGDTFSNLSAGKYTITVKDSMGCTGVSSETTIKNITNITATISVTDAACTSTIGAISITATGGTSPYQYSIDGGTTYQAGNSFSSLAVGAYPVRVKDATGCVYTDNSNVNDNGNVTFTTSLTKVDCGMTNGKVQINTTAGDAPFQFSTDNGVTFQTNSLFTGLASGSYSIVVKDVNGCSKASSVDVTDSTSTLALTTTDVNPTCSSPTGGQVTVNATGGAGSFTYSKDGGSTFGSSNVFSSLGEGTFNIVLKDANGCEKTKQVIFASFTPSFATVIAPLFSSEGCVGCHSKYATHAGIAGNKANIRNRVNRTIGSGGYMPKNGSLTAQQLSDLNCWIDAGAPNN